MADDIVTRLRDVLAVPNGVDIWTMTALQAADEIARLRSWIDRREPLKAYENKVCPMCYRATEYVYFGPTEAHEEGCPWREDARRG